MCVRRNETCRLQSFEHFAPAADQTVVCRGELAQEMRHECWTTRWTHNFAARGANKPINMSMFPGPCARNETIIYLWK